MHKYHVPCGWTRSTRASKDAVAGHHKRECVDACCGCLSFLFVDGMHAYSLDMWMLNWINMTTLTIKGNMIDNPNQ